MIYKCSFDGRWHKVNPNAITFNESQRQSRRAAFSSGIFRVEKNGDSYHLFVKNWSIGAWSPGDTERARMFIDIAFSAYYAMTGE